MMNPSKHFTHLHATEPDVHEHWVRPCALSHKVHQYTRTVCPCLVTGKPGLNGLMVVLTSAPAKLITLVPAADPSWRSLPHSLTHCGAMNRL